MSKKILLMDFDGTICDSNSIQQLLILQYHYRSLVGYLYWLIKFSVCDFPSLMLAYRKSQQVYNAKLFCLYKGMKVDKTQVCFKKQLADHIINNVYYEAMETILKYKKKAYEIAIISANNAEMIKAAFANFSYIQVHAVSLKVDNGRYSGEIDNNLEKSELIEQHYRGYDEKIFYGNSRYDLSACAVCDQGHLVNYNKPSDYKQHQWQRKYFRSFPSWIAYVVYALSFPFLRYIRLSKTSLNKGGIVVANHQSYLDHYFIGAIFFIKYKVKLLYLSKKEHFDSYFSNKIHTVLGGFPVNRQFGRGMMDFSYFALKFNRFILLYPEGTRTSCGKVNKFKKGINKISKENDSYIIPVVIDGLFSMLPKGRWMPRPSSIKMIISRPLKMVHIHCSKQDVADYLENIIRQMHGCLYRR